MDVTQARGGLAIDRLERVTDHLMRNFIDPGKLAGCQISVSRRGQPAYFRSLGQMDLERGRAMADDAIFRIYSMTKPITSVALMRLFEQGYFRLDDPVSRYIPEWRKQKVWVSGEGDDMRLEAPARPVTFRHLLSHTGGLTYGSLLSQFGAPGAEHPVDQAYDRAGITRGGSETLSGFVAKLGQVPLRFQPGEQWMYSLSTDVCGHLVEVISGKRFDDYLRETIFEPLGMTDTAFHVAPEKASRFAACYQRGLDRRLALVDDPARSAFLRAPSFLGGGGGLTGTSADYMRFCEMLRLGGALDGERILGPRTIDLMRANHLAGGRDLEQMGIGAYSESAKAGVGFGLGFAMTLDSVRTGALGQADYYWGGAASTLFWVDPAEALSVVFMTQLVPSGTFDFRSQLKNIIYSSIVD